MIQNKTQKTFWTVDKDAILLWYYSYIIKVLFFEKRRSKRYPEEANATNISTIG